MAAPYSYDFRCKALDALERGERKIDVCQMFGISRNTLDLWIMRKAETGDVQAITDYQQGARHKITDWERFRKFAQEHGDNTQRQMAKLWGDNVTQQNISHALCKIGLSRKKTYGYRERDEAERQEFVERLQTKQPQQIVSVDEAGVDKWSLD
jgi:transposase